MWVWVYSRGRSFSVIQLFWGWSTCGCLAVDFPGLKVGQIYQCSFFQTISSRSAKYDYSWPVPLTGTVCSFLNNSFEERLQIRLVLFCTSQLSLWVNIQIRKYLNLNTLSKVQLEHEGPAVITSLKFLISHLTEWPKSWNLQDIEPYLSIVTTFNDIGMLF
jgi:hypothetical protein